jgi:hypothetical protein
MNGKELLRTQYQFVYRTAKLNLDGFGAEASVQQPPNGANCANWILGHLVGAHNSAMRLVGQEPVWDSADLDRTKKGPVTSWADALDWDTLVSKLLASEARFMAGHFLAVHGNYHTGQLGMSRRLAALPGAIRAPR